MPTRTEESDLPLAAASSEPVEEVPVAAMPSPLEVACRRSSGDEIKITQGDRRYRVLGLEKNTTVGLLRVNLLVTRGREPARGHFRSVLLAASRDVQQAGGRGAGR